MLSILARKYLEVYARNNKSSKNYKEDQQMFELSVWYRVRLVSDTHSPTCHGTFMGQLEAKDGNKGASAAVEKSEHFVDLIDIFC